LFIDRSPHTFEIILEFLRSGKLVCVEAISRTLGYDLSQAVFREALAFRLPQIHAPEARNLVDILYPNERMPAGRPIPKGAPAVSSPMEPPSVVYATEELIVELQAEKEKWNDMLRSGTKSTNRCVTLNVGGKEFKTSLDVLTRHRYSFFGELFSGKYEIPSCVGGDALYIDRSPRAFEFVLDFLRTGDILLSRDSPIFQMVAVEAKYFNLQALLMQASMQAGGFGFRRRRIEHEGPYGPEPGCMSLSQVRHELCHSGEVHCRRAMVSLP